MSSLLGRWMSKQIIRKEGTRRYDRNGVMGQKKTWRAFWDGMGTTFCSSCLTELEPWKPALPHPL